MKSIFKRLLLAIAILSTLFAKAQFPTTDPNFRTFLTRTATLPVDSSFRGENQLYKNLLADGNLTKLDYLHIYAQSNQTNAAYNLTSTSFSATSVGSPVWTVSKGYTGATGKYENSNFNAATQGVQYTKNSCSYGCYLLTNQQETTPALAVSNGVDQISIYPRYSDDKIYARINSSSLESVLLQIVDARGLSVAVRTGASATELWKNGIKILSGTTASTNIPSFNIFDLGFNVSGTNGFNSTNTMAISFAGSGTIDQLNLYKSFEIYARTLGFNKSTTPVYTTDFFGDSFTFGQGATVQDSCWANMVWTTKSWEGQNDGVPGQSVTAPGAFSLSSLSLKGRYNKGLVLSWGINDANSTTHPGTTVSTFTAACNAVFNQCISNGYAYSEITVISQYLLYSAYQSNFPNYDAMAAALENLCLSLGVKYINCKAYMSAHGGDALFVVGGANDGHPNNTGYKVIRDYVLSQMGICPLLLVVYRRKKKRIYKQAA